MQISREVITQWYSDSRFPLFLGSWQSSQIAMYEKLLEATGIEPVAGAEADLRLRLLDRLDLNQRPQSVCTDPVFLQTELPSNKQILVGDAGFEPAA